MEAEVTGGSSVLSQMIKDPSNAAVTADVVGWFEGALPAQVLGLVVQLLHLGIEQDRQHPHLRFLAPRHVWQTILAEPLPIPHATCHPDTDDAFSWEFLICYELG